MSYLSLKGYLKFVSEMEKYKQDNYLSICMIHNFWLLYLCIISGTSVNIDMKPERESWEWKKALREEYRRPIEHLWYERGVGASVHLRKRGRPWGEQPETRSGIMKSEAHYFVCLLLVIITPNQNPKAKRILNKFIFYTNLEGNKISYRSI